MAAEGKADGTGVPGHGGDGAEVAEESTQVVAYAAAIDVAKGSGMVCTRVPGSRPDRRALNENLQAMVRLVRAAVPGMVARRWGRICLITSSAVKEPMPALALSNTARTGLWAWAKTAAQDLRQHGVTLNLACPGYHATDRLKAIGGAPDGLLAGDPADFGKIVAFLCSEPAGFVSGAALQVDGAQSVLGLL